MQTCTNLQYAFANICHCKLIQTYANLWKHMQTNVNKWKQIQTYARLGKYMQIHANPYKLMQIHTDIENIIHRFAKIYLGLHRFELVCKCLHNLVVALDLKKYKDIFVQKSQTVNALDFKIWVIHYQTYTMLSYANLWKTNTNLQHNS